MIKAIIFDLDGVLVDADKWHFDALNDALRAVADMPPITWQEHLTIYKGIPTKKKLQILTERRGLAIEHHAKINELKQECFLAVMDSLCKPNAETVETLRMLKQQGLKIAVCSNAIRESVREMLTHAGLAEYIEFYLGNEDVINPKPAPDIYLKAFEMLTMAPEDCLIVEDSAVGRQAAFASGANVCEVEGPDEINFYRILKGILETERTNVVIPAAGQGKRFAEAGYVYPKPLIPMNGMPMIGWVLSTVEGVGRNILLMQASHIKKYCLDYLLKDVRMIPVDGITEGAACTVLLAKELINNDAELIIANSDQYLNYPIIGMFAAKMRAEKADGGMITFESTDSKWSYAKEIDGLVIEVAEKNPISTNATAGVYYFKHGKDFVRWAERMIEKNIRVNNEFYVCPVFNEAIIDGAKIRIYPIENTAMHGLGTPEDLKAFMTGTQ